MKSIFVLREMEEVTLNQYTYCWSSPMGLVDLDGRDPAETEFAEWLQNNKLLEKTFGEWAFEQAEKYVDGEMTFTEKEEEFFGRGTAWSEFWV